MTYRNIFILFIVMASICTSAAAQPRMGGRGNRAEEQVKRINEKVGLTESQAKQVQEILLKLREEARAEFENNGGDREAMREIMMKQTVKADSAIAKLLTKEQKPKFEEFKKERQKEMQERMRERQ